MVKWNREERVKDIDSVLQLIMAQVGVVDAPNSKDSMNIES